MHLFIYLSIYSFIYLIIIFSFSEQWISEYIVTVCIYIYWL